jgi:glycosyltransferase involved in cell wall biosynthesis
MIRCTVGVLAHNEEQNVERTLHALLVQELHAVEIVEIVVIASGCTDATVELAERIANANPIVTVDVETHRTGKAAAIRRLMSVARGEVIVLANGDTLPEPTAVEHLVQPFSDPSVGMTGARVIPLNPPTSWLGFSVQMLWHVHHRLALRRPKLGELVAFRNVIDDFPADTSTDEPAIEALIAAKRYRLVYTPKAIVYNRGPEDAHEFVIQRRRIFAGQVRIALRYGYFTSSLRLRHVLPLTLDAIRNYPRFFIWIFAAIAVEARARALGLYDGLFGRENPVWRTADSTKRVAPGTNELTLISIKWPPGAVDSVRFLREIRRLPEPDGSVFWWDDRQGEMLVSVGPGSSPLEWLQDRIEGATREHVRPHPVYSNAPDRLSVSWVRPVYGDQPVVTCRLVRFASAPELT